MKIIKADHIEFIIERDEILYKLEGKIKDIEESPEDIVKNFLIIKNNLEIVDDIEHLSIKVMFPFLKSFGSIINKKNDWVVISNHLLKYSFVFLKVKNDEE